MRKNGESDQRFKNRFTAERSRQFDLLQSKEVTDQNADGCWKRAYQGCIDVEKVSELLFDRGTAYIAQLFQGNHFSNAAGSRIITNLKPEVRDNVYCFMYPEEYTVTENDESDSSSSTSDDEELGNDDEEEHEQRDVAQH
ncbi:unnamed protein product [Porites evermanni]|uniref:Uncharacterized protein n=1 Tax=Porites evermanni TaxID=104178 RepID=A0ABN8MFP6_9CNID|nr:unnamed protein product [Porites evermanni]